MCVDFQTYHKIKQNLLSKEMYVDLSLKVCAAIHNAGGYFTLENPARSWIWAFDECLHLAEQPGVAYLVVRYWDFGTSYVKPTCFFHNVPTLHEMIPDKMPVFNPTVLRGKVAYNGQQVFRTALASPYPSELGLAYGKCLKAALDLKLIAEGQGLPAPRADMDYNAGNPLPAHALAHSQQHGLQGVGPELCIDDNPYVPDGCGQPKGLSKLEQVTWQLQQKHPLQVEDIFLNEDLKMAVAFELDHDVNEIDGYRNVVLNRLAGRAEALQGEQRRWAEQADPRIRHLVAGIHGPLVAELCIEMGFKDDRLVHDLLCGFPYIGILPESHEAVKKEVPRPLGYVTWDNLKEDRRASNDNILAKLRASEWEDDIWAQTQEDIALGAMANLVRASDLDLSQVTLSRRLPVREERQQGWRTRVVDDKTESGINEACQPQERLTHDTLDMLIAIILAFIQKGVQPALWKRDISRAFRRVAIAAEHLELSWVAFLRRGVAWAAQHTAMPFGTTSAVYAWHRVGAMLLAVVLRICKAPAARFVDDYFGCSKTDVFWSGGRCLSVLAKMLGFPTADHKDADDLLNMVVLGAQVSVLMDKAKITVQISEDKAVKYGRILENILKTRFCSAEVAVKIAGRLAFAVTVAAGKVGRAYIKPFYAQAYAPRRHSGVSPWMAQAADWWQQYLRAEPVMSHLADSAGKKHVNCWTDASGEARWLAAVIHDGSRWWWARVQVPEYIWNQLLPRGDHQIGLQELLAIVLAIHTFPAQVTRSLLSIAVDNQGVLHSVLQGRAGAEDANRCIAKLWLDIASMEVSMHILRVESFANLADGPARGVLSLMQLLKAEWVQPRLPGWLMDIWRV